MTKTALDRRETARVLLGSGEDLLAVLGLGGTVWDAMAAGDRDLSFYMWGGMGLATATGLGLALAQPRRRVLVLTGDGEMLMGLGSLATVGRKMPSNLAVVVMDNELYGETGGQPSHTSERCDLAGIARAAGINDSRIVTNADELADFRNSLNRLGTESQGPLFAAIKTPGATSSPGNPLPPRDGAFLKSRFRDALLDAKQATATNHSLTTF